MAENIITVADGFWNFRGSYRVGGVIDVGTQSSLVRLASGRFVLLDAYSLGRPARRLLSELTGDGDDLEAVINLHPFHTTHVRAIHGLYPQATHYGTARHHEKFPDLPWAATRSEDTTLHQRYAEDFDFSIPRGVDFISDDENVHFSSVLALHRDSGTIHSDDTLMYLGLPKVLQRLGLGDSVSFHPTLGKALERRAGAAQDFRDWAMGLIDAWGDAENLCAAHTSALLAVRNHGAILRTRLVKALECVESTLARHERRYL